MIVLTFENEKVLIAMLNRDMIKHHKHGIELDYYKITKLHDGKYQLAFNYKPHEISLADFAEIPY